MTNPRKRRLKFFVNQRAAANSLGVSLDAVRAAAAGGCEAFRNGRVYAGELAAWLSTHQDDLPAGDGLRVQLLQEQIRKLRLANDIKAGRYVARADVCETLSRIIGRMTREVEDKLTREYPNAVAGMDVPGARVYGRRIFDQVLEALNQCKEEWTA